MAVKVASGDLVHLALGQHENPSVHSLPASQDVAHGAIERPGHVLGRPPAAATAPVKSVHERRLSGSVLQVSKSSRQDCYC